jgi:hypothetical protein
VSRPIVGAFTRGKPGPPRRPLNTANLPPLRDPFFENGEPTEDVDDNPPDTGPNGDFCIGTLK